MEKLTQSIHTDILKYSSNNFKLKDDLVHLQQVYSARASEAVIFYCARILEVVVSDAFEKFFSFKNSLSLAEKSDILKSYNLLSKTKFYWAKGLRSLGNDVRHINRRVRFEEADTAIFFLSFCLFWFFCEFPLGKKKNSIYKPNETLVPKSHSSLEDLAWKLESKNIDQQKLARLIISKERVIIETFHQNPTLPTLLLDMLLEIGPVDSVGRIIQGIESQRSKLSGYYPRFIELKGLYLSRTGRYREAIEVLDKDSYIENNRWVEEERLGILGGVYKKIWQVEGDVAALKESYSLYKRGWGQQKKRENTYLGINLATTALWLGKKEKSINVAQNVQRTLEIRRKTILEKTDRRYDLDYWDHVTLAEAKLLTGNYQESVDLYRKAFSQFNEQSQNIKVSRTQLKNLLDFISVESAIQNIYLEMAGI